MSDHQADTEQAPDDVVKGVFINCPFDSEFEPLFQAIIFSVVSCDFTPRSALETGTVSEPRMDRITRSIFSSKYSIHDLSRCKGEGPDTTPPPTPKSVLDSLPEFVHEYEQLKNNWGDDPPWPYVVEAARKAAPKT